MKVYEPAARVLLIKARRRTSMGDLAPKPAAARHANFASMDLTAYVSDAGGIRTAKSVREPSGGFSITLKDVPVGAMGESPYGLIEPMDIIEIRMSHDPVTPLPDRKSAWLPLIMRGLVSTVSRSESIDESGRPVRSVTVTGQDFGKILQTLRIYYLPGSTVGELWLDEFKFFRTFNLDAVQKPAADWVSEIVANVITPYMQKLLAVADGRALGVQVPRELVPQAWVQGTVSPLGIAQFNGGSVYDLMRQFLDVGPFNELYVDDREDGVRLVCRPAPWRRLDGSYVEVGAWSETVNVSDADMMSITVARSDDGVANYFWVNNAAWEMIYNANARQAAVSEGGKDHILDKYENSRVDIYGLRAMETSSALGSLDYPQSPGPAAANLPKNQQSLGLWLDDRRRVLAEANRDNVVLETGSMRLRGRPDIRPGMYIELTRAGVTSSCYAVRVEHEFTPGYGYFTSVSFERGTGFVERSSLGGSPWLTEIDLRGTN